MTHTRSKHSRLMIAVLPDESSAFEAYRLLQCHGISPEHLALVGKGYSSPDSVGLFNPTFTAWRYAKRGMFWLGVISTVMGVILYLISGFIDDRLNLWTDWDLYWWRNWHFIWLVL
ncbi:MAG: hypothetical protein NTU99_06895 [Pseudanabaena sp. LacPavin_0818_WC45_MAG_42_6]|nr:hypothetical protein [Pseudanabaena sp. LacPavin_0818_WC45_MAG_42_6]